MKTTPQAPLLVGMVSSHREGELAALAVRGLLDCCQTVVVLEGPVGDVPSLLGSESRFPRDSRMILRTGGPWESDAAKRSELLAFATGFASKLAVGAGAWGVVVDGDEELLYGYALPAYLARAAAGAPDGGLGLMTLKICEADGQVMESGARLLPLGEFSRYLLSSHVLERTGSGVSVTLPLRPATRAPIMGEPHILHRSYLRPPDRAAPAQRLSTYELDDLRKIGLAL